jgi:nucleoside-specific outer membrane channel protein Tsx
LQPNVNNNGWGAQANMDGTIYLPGKLQFGTYSTYQYNAATASFHQSISLPIINLFVTKTFLKNDNLSIEAWENDVFNQNSGITRVAAANQITQTINNTLKRYFMLTINYNFTKMGGQVSK